MPPAAPDTLGDAVYAQLLAYLAQENGVTAGTRELTSDAAALRAAMLPAAAGGPSGGLTTGVRIPAPPPRANPLDRLTAVTDAMLTSPADGEWLTWRRSFDNLGFSPLTQINKQNVADLRLAWSWALPNGPNEVTPLVHDGVMFVHGYGDKVQAIDAATGDLLWQYSRRLPKDRAAVGEARHRASTATSSTCRPPTPTWSRSTRRRAMWCGTTRWPTTRPATA